MELNSENTKKEEIKDFEIIERNFPIIISAPHSTKQLRNGKVQSKENYTDILATNVSDKENVSCIYKTTFLNDDANADEESNYKNALKEYVIANDVKYLIDLHTMSDKRLPNVCIGINGGKNIMNKYDILQGIVNAFATNGISSVTVDEPFKATDPNCISNFIATNCNIPCFQIEINKKFASFTTVFSKSPFNKKSVEEALCEAVKFLKDNL